MNIISVGDLVLDYYYKNNKLIGINGGMTSHNIIANLAKMGLNTKYQNYRKYKNKMLSHFLSRWKWKFIFHIQKKMSIM